LLLEAFLSAPGLLPFAALSKTDDQETALRQVAERIQAVPTQNMQRNLTATTAILSALVLKEATIQRILRSDLSIFLA
jgi:predicted transposase YdaD